MTDRSVLDEHRRAPALSLSLLGRFQLADQDVRVALPGGTERLLALLALNGRAAKRSFVAGTLWPDATEGHAFGNLRSALSRLGPDGKRAVRADTAELELAADVAVDLRDARALAMRLLAPVPTVPTAPTAPRALPVVTPFDLSTDAVEVLSLELLPGWYDDWAVVEAEDWRQLRLHALEALAGQLCEAGRFGEAVVAACASVRAEPMRESAHACLIRVHLAEGNRGEAIHQLERLRAILRTELGIEPGDRVTSLIA